jgi:two-component system LytT family response regulator
MLKCLAVDDEPLALDLLVDNIRQVPFLHLEGSCKNALEAMEFIQSKKPDLVFLDIQMPGLSGIQLAEHLRGKAMVIFLTAYESHALKGFDVNAIDYLLKPVTQERFIHACMKALEWHTLRKPMEDKAVESEPTPASVNNPAKFLFVYVDYNLVRIDINDIRYIEGFKDYVKIHLQSSKRPVVTRMSMKLLEDKLLAYSFLRIHKSFIISVDKVTSVQKSMLAIDADELPVSESYRDSLMELIRKQNIL